MTVETFDANGTWTCPAGVTEALVECWGCASDGGNGVAFMRGGHGGGSGAYARLDAFACTPGNNYTCTVPAGNAGATTIFNLGSCIAANATANSVTGGTAAASTGDVKYSGADGLTPTFGQNNGGGGAGSGGSNGAGSAGAYSAGGAAGTDGGAGGNGGIEPSDGAAGAVPGGGGGGGSITKLKGAGASGRIRITYTDPPVASSHTTPIMPCCC